MSDPTSLPFFDEPADGTPLRSRVLAALALVEARGPVEGQGPVVDEDGDVAVVHNGQLVFVRCVESRPALMRVFGQWRLGPLPGDETALLRAANAVTGGLNLIKASVLEDRLSVACDVIVVEGMDLAGLLPAIFDAVFNAVRTFHGAVNELAGGAPRPPDGQDPAAPAAEG